MPFAGDIYYANYPKDPLPAIPLILIHGAGASHLAWPTQMRRFPNRNTYAIDLPGHGKSTGTGEQTIPAYAEVVLSWLQEMNLYRVIIMGHSMGTAIALELARTFPRYVAGLVLIGTAPHLRVSPVLLEDLSTTFGVAQAINNVMQWSFSPGTESGLKEKVLKGFMEIRPSVFQGDLLACDAYNASAFLPEITTPTLVINGSEDRMTTPRGAQLLASSLPNAQITLIPGAGHMVPLENTPETLDAITPFLDAIKY